MKKRSKRVVNLDDNQKQVVGKYTSPVYEKFVAVVRTLLPFWPHHHVDREVMFKLLTDPNDAFVCYLISDTVNICDVDELVAFIKSQDELVDAIASHGKVVVVNSTGTAYVGWRPDGQRIGDDTLDRPDEPEIVTCGDTDRFTV